MELRRIVVRAKTPVVTGLALLVGTAAVVPRTAAQTPPVRVALSGTAAPAGGNYAHPFPTTFQQPVVNESGRVYFYADLTGGTATAGLFAGTPGALQTVALQGTAAPAGGNFTNSFSDLVQNGAGQVAFSCSLTGGAASQGLFVGTPGALQTVFVTGTPAPGGGNYAPFVSTPVLNGSGVVAFRVGLTGGTSTEGLFAGAPGSVQAVALLGAPSPAGGNYSFLSNRPVLNASGQVAFWAQYGGGTNAGVFFGTPGTIQVAAQTGNPAPAGGNYVGFGSPKLNDAGRVAFVSSLTGGSSTAGVFFGTPGAVQPVALQGTAAPAGGNYSSFYFEPALNGAGQVAFRADLTGGTSTSGLFIGVPGAVEAITLQGAAAPGGGDFSTFVGSPILNRFGQFAFVATLAGAGVTTANDRGLYAGSVGALVKVVREGDLVDVDPGAGVDLRAVATIGFRGEFETATGLQDGRGGPFTDGGLLAYSLTFTDGTSGVFVSSVAPVPEPATAALVAGLAAAALAARRRRPNPGLCPRS
jgi:hypothetical protein